MSNPYSSPGDFDPATYPAIGNTRTLKRIHVVQAGVVLRLLYALFGCLAIPFLLLMAAIGRNAGGLNGMGAAEVGVGGAMLLMIPIMYGIGGFIGGMIAALIYNLIASLTGGLRFDME